MNEDFKINKIKLRIINSVFALSLLPWLFFLLGSFFAFDAPGSEKDIFNWILVLSIWTYPIIVLVSIFISNSALNEFNSNQDYSFGISLLPLINILIVFFIFLTGDIAKEQYLNELYTSSDKDFICGSGGFLRINNERIELVAPGEISLISEINNGEIYDDFGYFPNKDSRIEFIKSCKNT